MVEDEYYFGPDLLVAPLFDANATGRRVYLPPGAWIDYQTGRVYQGARWQEIAAGAIPVVLLARDGAAIPHAAVAQNTAAIDWTRLELRVFSSQGGTTTGTIALPDGEPQAVEVRGSSLVRDPLGGRVRWTITRAGTR